MKEASKKVVGVGDVQVENGGAVEEISGQAHWIKNGEGFIFYEGDDIDVNTWSVKAWEFEEVIGLVDLYQEDKGLWGLWFVRQITGLLRRCKAAGEFTKNYKGRRLMWWWMYANQ